MTFHPRSAVEFGFFLARVSESLLSDAPLSQSLELIRVQLGSDAVALRVEDRMAAGRGPVFIAGADAATGQDGSCLSELVETMHHMTATAVSELDGTRFTLWVFRELSSPNFDREENSVCAMLVAHVRRSMELSQRIGANEIERTLYSSIMDRLCVGVVILDLSGRVLRCSPKAEEALAARDGLQLQAGKLRATCAKEDRALQAAIKAATLAADAGEALSGRGLALTKPSGNRSLGVIVQTVQGVQRAGVATASSVAIYIRDPDANAEVESELVRQLFDLTPAEAAVARRLTAGLSLEDAAHSLDISRNTARAHLRSIFSKSGITRQTELVRLMLNSAAVLGERPRQVA